MDENILENRTYWQRFLEQLKCDYATPRFKAEVTFDTLLLPKIVVELVEKAFGKEHCQNLKFLTKEYPILNYRVGIGGNDNRSFCIDYLLCDDNKMYLVELKTDKKSVDNKQLGKYQKLVDAQNFSETYYEYMERIRTCDKKRYAKQAEHLKNLREDFHNDVTIIYIVPADNALLDKQKIKYVSLQAALNNIENYSSLTQTFLKIWQRSTADNVNKKHK